MDWVRKIRLDRNKECDEKSLNYFDEMKIEYKIIALKSIRKQ